MTTESSQRMTPGTPDEGGRPPDAGEPLSTLRGAGVRFDVHQIRRVASALCIVTLSVLIVVFVLAGIHRNNQVSTLHHHGVPVTVTVTGCTGQLGGSGSNTAGYTCRGAFVLGGRHYNETLPGNTFLDPGSRLRAVAVPSDPALVATVRAVSMEHTSWRVFLLPAILLVILVVVVGLVLRVARRNRETAEASQYA
jgi:hypothetical protein